MSKFQPFPSTNCFATKLLGGSAVVLFIWRSILIHRGLCTLTWAFCVQDRGQENACIFLPLLRLSPESLSPLPLLPSAPHPEPLPCSLLSSDQRLPLSLTPIILAQLGPYPSNQWLPGFSEEGHNNHKRCRRSGQGFLFWKAPAQSVSAKPYGSDLSYTYIIIIIIIIERQS